MADPSKFKSVSVPIDTYKKLSYLADGKFLDAKLTISKTIEALATRAAKKTGYKIRVTWDQNLDSFLENSFNSTS